MDCHSAYRIIRDIILGQDLYEPSLLGPRLKALYHARLSLEADSPVRKGDACWEVRGSPQGKDEEGRTLYVWHRATMNTCTCSAFYSQQGFSVNNVTCEHRMVAWLLTL